MRSPEAPRKTTARGPSAGGVVAVILLAVSASLPAGELGLFGESAPPPRLAVPVSAEEDALRLVDLEHSYPWSGGGSLDLGLTAQDPQPSPKAPENVPETVAPTTLPIPPSTTMTNAFSVKALPTCGKM